MSRSWIVVSDSHVSKNFENDSEFFEMLAHISRSEHDLVFLGDILDLWISLPGYEDEVQQRFLAWCTGEKKRRMVGFVEGNHEFYVSQRHGDAFSWSTGEHHVMDHAYMVHGDQINLHDKNYLRWRKISKNPATRITFRFLPFGPAIARKLKSGLKKTNKAFRINLPQKEVDRFGQELFDKGFRHVIVGHFHKDYRLDGQPGQFLQIMPDWYATGKIGLYDGDQLRMMHWKELLLPHE